MLKKIGIGVAALVALLLVVVSMQPATYRVERKVTIQAASGAVYKHLEDLHAWAEWSPWDKIDPGMKRTFEGPKSGVGAIYEWSGNDEVGKGRMTITEVTEPTRVQIKLEFIEPFASLAQTEFSLAENGPETVVTWSMAGDNDFMGKAFSLVMDMDAMIGADFEKGLATLKSTVEAGR